jgi:hypothetical protein
MAYFLIISLFNTVVKTNVFIAKASRMMSEDERIQIVDPKGRHGFCSRCSPAIVARMLSEAA